MNPLLPGKLGTTIHNYFSLSIGSGFSTGGSAYALGIRLYPLGKTKDYRPRIGFYYGTVAIVEGWGDSFNIEGLALSAGATRKITDKIALEADFVYIISAFGWGLDSLNSPYKVSFGLRYLLGGK